MASTKRATATTGKKTRKFTTLQEMMSWLNAGNKVISLTASSGMPVGEEVGLVPNFTCYLNGTQLYVSVVRANGVVNNFNWNVNYVGYYSASTLSEIQEELKEAKEVVDLLTAKIAYMKETGAEEFDENEFKVFNTLSILDEKKLSKLEKAKAIAALINNK